MNEYQRMRPGRGPQEQNRAKQTASILFRERVFPLSLRFDLDGSSLRFDPSRPKPFGETKKLFPCAGILPGLEAPCLPDGIVVSLFPSLAWRLSEAPFRNVREFVSGIAPLLRADHGLSGPWVERVGRAIESDPYLSYRPRLFRPELQRRNVSQVEAKFICGPGDSAIPSEP